MENNKIKIEIKGLQVHEVDNSNPSFSELIKEIVKNIDKIDLTKISVKSSDENFDNEGFEEILKDSIKEFIDKAKIESDSIESIKTKIKTEKDNLNKTITIESVNEENEK
jgi:N-acetylglutamate synthase-like GNAT family acetyltransferase